MKRQFIRSLRLECVSQLTNEGIKATKTLFLIVQLRSNLNYWLLQDFISTVSMKLLFIPIDIYLQANLADTLTLFTVIHAKKHFLIGSPLMILGLSMINLIAHNCCRKIKFRNQCESVDEKWNKSVKIRWTTWFRVFRVESLGTHQ